MKTRHLSNIERTFIVQILLTKSVNGKPPRGQMLAVANKFGVCRKTITDIWNKAKKQMNNGVVINVDSKMKGKKCHAKKVFDEELFKSLDLKDRTTEARIAAKLGVSQSTIAKWVANKVINSHTNSLKPGLTDKNKLAMLLFCLKSLHLEPNIDFAKFNDQSNVIHLDEKWFYLTKINQRYYLVNSESLPERCVQSKAFIPKIMFMCAVARPIYDANDEVIFDGKIGLFPMTVEEPAKRSSKNREKGTMETKPVESVNRQVVKHYLIDVVLPTIKAKWPSTRSKHIIIQQDNARPHIDNKDPDWQKACMIEILTLRGGNGYKIPHMHKSKLAKAGLLPEYLLVDRDIITTAVTHLQNLEAATGVEDLVAALSMTTPRLQ
ncbi:uncharacterized protein LOC141630947 [Silene latifolia]|uniref:uncharacterized protein LOC141630947 n=1 Tax=Silene latifolia TaxID=37657 RepID=UPI003D783835